MNKLVMGGGNQINIEDAPNFNFAYCVSSTHEHENAVCKVIKSMEFLVGFKANFSYLLCGLAYLTHVSCAVSSAVI